MPIITNQQVKKWAKKWTLLTAAVVLTTAGSGLLSTQTVKATPAAPVATQEGSAVTAPVIAQPKAQLDGNLRQIGDASDVTMGYRQVARVNPERAVPASAFGKTLPSVQTVNAAVQVPGMVAVKGNITELNRAMPRINAYLSAQAGTVKKVALVVQGSARSGLNVALPALTSADGLNELAVVGRGLADKTTPAITANFSYKPANPLTVQVEDLKVQGLNFSTTFGAKVQNLLYRNLSFPKNTHLVYSHRIFANLQTFSVSKTQNITGASLNLLDTLKALNWDVGTTNAVPRLPTNLEYLNIYSDTYVYGYHDEDNPDLTSQTAQGIAAIDFKHMPKLKDVTLRNLRLQSAPVNLRYCVGTVHLEDNPIRTYYITKGTIASRSYPRIAANALINTTIGGGYDGVWALRYESLNYYINNKTPGDYVGSAYYSPNEHYTDGAHRIPSNWATPIDSRQAFVYNATVIKQLFLTNPNGVLTLEIKPKKDLPQYNTYGYTQIRVRDLMYFTGINHVTVSPNMTFNQDKTDTSTFKGYLMDNTTPAQPQAPTFNMARKSKITVTVSPFTATDPKTGVKYTADANVTADGTATLPPVQPTPALDSHGDYPTDIPYAAPAKVAYTDIKVPYNQPTPILDPNVTGKVALNTDGAPLLTLHVKDPKQMRTDLKYQAAITYTIAPKLDVFG